MPRRQEPFIVRILAEGNSSDKLLEREEVFKQSRILASKTPSNHVDKQMHVGNLLRKALRGEVDKNVFIQYVRLTRTYVEVQNVYPRILREEARKSQWQTHTKPRQYR